MYLLLISALSSPALCAEADVSTIKKYIQDHNDGVNATSVEVVSAADVYSSSSSHDNEQASSVAGVNYSSKGGSNKKKHNYNVEPQLSDDEKRQKLRDIIKTRANQELRTADDCLVEIDGEIINLLYVSYQLYQKPEDLNHELIVLDRHRGRSFGMHIFRSLSDKELDKLLNIPTKDGEYVRDIAGQDLIDVFRKRVVAHNPDLKVKKDRERASYALTLKRTRYDAVEKLKMQQELEQLAHEQANAQQKLHIDQNEEII
jgi:hypothetical protein